MICYDRRVLGEGYKNYFKDWCLMNSQPIFLFFNQFKLNELCNLFKLNYGHIILSM